MLSYTTDEEYQNDILNFFDLSEYNSDKIMGKIEELYLKIKDIPEFREKMRTSANQYMSEDLEMGLVIQFSYDHFKEFHTLLEAHSISF
jgi:hypothetical protein